MQNGLDFYSYKKNDMNDRWYVPIPVSYEHH